jgi:hypothetical protein
MAEGNEIQSSETKCTEECRSNYPASARVENPWIMKFLNKRRHGK